MKPAEPVQESNQTRLVLMPRDENQDQPMPDALAPASLMLDSRLSEITRAQIWAEALADRLRLSEEVRYAVLLCLEEALANVVLHGYRNEPGHPICLRACVSDDALLFEVQDKAPPFALEDALRSTERGDHVPLESLSPGGYGLGLLRHFSRSLVHEKLADGNRLAMSFPYRCVRTGHQAAP